MKKIPEIRFPEFSGEWVEKKLGEILDYEQPTKFLVKNTEYKTKGIPVLTAGKTFLLGYTDENFGIYNSNLPVILFDDFTTDTKFVTFPFKLKSSAIKILHSKETYNIKFIFEQMKNIKFKVGGHQRHWINVFSKIKIHIPPTLSEQQKIADFLNSVDEKIEIVSKKIDKLKKNKKGLLQKLLNVKCESGKCEPELRFKEFSRDWIKVKVKDIFDKITRGYVLSTKEISPIKTDEYKYSVYSSQTLNNGLLGYYKDYLYENAITWTTDGANAGKVMFRKGKFYCTNVSGVLISTKGYANQCIAEILNRVTKKYVSYVGNPKLMNNVMAEIPIFIPPTLDEQEKIAEFLSSIDEKIELNENKLQALKRYKQGLLQKMFV